MLKNKYLYRTVPYRTVPYRRHPLGEASFRRGILKERVCSLLPYTVIHRKEKTLIAIILICTILSTTFNTTFNSSASGYSLSETQEERAETIAEILTENWEEYGCLPSVCIGQAYIESHIGNVCYKNNLWGLHGGYKSYSTLEDGIYAYMKVINNGYYDDALYELDYEAAIKAIKAGGYCTSTDYVSNVIWAIETFDLTKYDEAILDKYNADNPDELLTYGILQ